MSGLIRTYQDGESGSTIRQIINNALTKILNLSAVATSGAYNDLSGKPNLAAVATSGAYNDLSGKPTLFDGSYNSLSNKPSLATVASSGAYNDLSGKPSIPTLPGPNDNVSYGKVSCNGVAFKSVQNIMPNNEDFGYSFQINTDFSRNRFDFTNLGSFQYISLYLSDIVLGISGKVLIKTDISTTIYFQGSFKLRNGDSLNLDANSYYILEYDVLENNSVFLSIEKYS